MEQEDSVIKKTEKRLFSNEPGNLEIKRGRLSDLKYDARSSWGEETDNNMLKINKKFPTLFWLLMASFVFFMGAVGFAVYLGMEGTNTISPENVDISITGPVSVKAGEDFNIPIIITNKNNISLEYVDLIVTFPDGSKIYTNKSNENQFRKNLGVIKPNEAISETIKTALFGEENGEKQILVKIEYRNENSNAIIEKEALFKTVISASPLSLYFDVPSDANSNQEMIINAKIVANSKEILKDVMFNLSYPSGFIFKESTPSPTSGENSWELGDLKQGQEKLIKVKGVLQGQDNEEKTFRASAGTRTNRDSNKVDVSYASSVKTLAIKKPFIGLNLTLNGNSDDVYVVSDNTSVRGDIEWANNLPVNLLHGELTVKLTGEVLDKSSVDSSKGFYKSVENTIIWDKNSGGIPDLLEVGQGNRSTFVFRPLSLLSGKRAIFKNPEINLEVKFKGIRSSEGREDGSLVEASLSRKVRVNSNLQVSPRALYYSGPFKNTGPLPPIHDNETTYTVVWSIVNSSNDVSGVAVRATLPPNARWIGASSPDYEKLIYNPLGGEIVWNVGSVKAGGGVTVPAREVSFQIGITPSLSQVGTYPVLISESVITGKDDFTKADITYSRRALTTQLSSDSSVSGESAGAVK